MSLTPLAGNRGLPSSAVHTTQDEELEALMLQKERLRLVLDGTRLGIWDWNPMTNEVSFNERWAEMLGWSLDEIEPTLESWSSRVHPDDLDGCLSDIQAHVDGEVSFYENIHRMRHRDGTWRYILDRGRIMERDEAGRPTRFTGTHTDITAQKMAELDAIHHVERQKRLLATMSHEIRTPLNGIVGIVDILQSQELSEPVARWIDLMAQCSSLLQTVLDDILHLGKLDENQLQLDCSELELTEVLERSVLLFSAQAHQTATALSFTPSVGLPARALGDRHRLQQIVMNLVSNAVKFAQGGDVRVTASYVDELLTLVVEDTGIGIPDTEVIWDIYGQADASISRHYGGTGLGLPIVKRLVMGLGGTIEVRSTVGIGSTFTVRLPLAAAPAPGSEGASSTAAAQLPRGLRVLVAEDNPVNRMVLQSMLDQLHCASTFVEDGQAAVRAARNQAFDLILMDVHMPVMDGPAATRSLRQQRCTVPVVALTADSMPENRARCEAAGMDAFLTKPLQQDALAHLLLSLPARPQPPRAEAG